jgi:hypothetical protein
MEELMENHSRLSSSQCIRRGFKVAALALALIVIQPRDGLGAPPKPPQNLPVTAEIFDIDLNNLSTTIGSDGFGAYTDGVNSVSSYLQTNVCGGLTWGDWVFDTRNSAARSVSETYLATDEVQPGDLHYQAPAMPPYLGSRLQKAFLHLRCTCTVGQSIYTMAGGTHIVCPLNNNWWDSSGNEWSLNPGYAPETTDVQVTCNGVGTDGFCNDWTIDPDPLEGAEAVGRLGKTPPHNKPTINEGDFYMRFHIHITRP